MESIEFKSSLRRTAILPTALVLALAAVLLAQNFYLKHAFDRSESTDLFIVAARQCLRYSLDMETALRDYLLTGNEQYLESYRNAQPRVHGFLDQLQTLASNDPQLAVQVHIMRSRFEKWTAYNDIMLSTTHSREAVADVQLNLEHQRLLDEFRRSRDTALDMVVNLRKARAARVRAATRWMLILISTLGTAVAIIVAIQLYRHTSRLASVYTYHLDQARQSGIEAEKARGLLLVTLHSIAEIVIATDTTGHLMFANTLATDWLHQGESKLAGKKIDDCMKNSSESMRRAVLAPIRETLDSQRSVATVAEIVMAGDPLPQLYESTSGPILASDGTLLGAVLVMRNVTDQKRVEAALRAGERLAIVGRLAATIAHEIRNPLDAVMNLLYLVRQAGISDEASRHIETAEAELGRIVQITGQLLSFNREAPEPIKVDVSALVRDVLGLFQAKISGAGVSVIAELVESAVVRGYPGELRQVVSNIVANAIDAMKSGGSIRIRVSKSADWRDLRQKGVRITIGDNGSGISKESLRQLFSPFFTTKGEKGTGLGLWVSKGIITKHNGTLNVFSRTGVQHGTIFSIFLPENSPAQIVKRRNQTSPAAQ